MKKIILSAILLVLVAIFVGSFITGPLTQSMIEQQVAEINKLPGYQAELVEYNGGWRNASGKVSIGFDIDFYTKLSAEDLTPEQAAGLTAMSNDLILDLQVAHGPILIDDGLFLGLASVQLQPDTTGQPALASFQTKAGVEAFFTLAMDAGLLGDTTFVLKSPSWQIEDSSEGSMFSFGGAVIDGSYNLRTKALRTEGAIQPLKFSTANGSFEMAAAELHADLEVLNDMVSLGEMTLKVSEIKGAGGEGAADIKQLAIDDVVVYYSGERDGDDTVKMAVQYAIGKITTPEEDFSKLNFQIVFEHFGIDALQNYYDQLMALYQSNSDAAVMEQQQLAMMATLGTELLQYSPVIDITDLSFAMNNGAFASHARVAFDGEEADVSAAGLANPLMLISRLKVESAMNIDKNLLDSLGVPLLAGEIRSQLTAQGQQMSDDEINALAQIQLQSTLDQQLQKGFFVAAEKGYSAAFSMDKGAMLLNGQPFSPFGAVR